MSYLLDILGSSAIAAGVIFMVMQFNTRVNDTSGEILLSTITQGDALMGAEIMQYDFYKMGFNVPGSAIVNADSNNIKFYADLNYDGTKDSIFYSFNYKSDSKYTTNPNDIPVFRKINNESSHNLINVSEFNISYFDSIGNEISSAKLVNQSARDQIKTISIFLRAESAESIDTMYQGIEWFRTIRPKNL